MKILVNPDIHGRTFWTNGIERIGDFDKIIFLGDYLDPYHFENIDVESAIANFIDIMCFAKENADKVVLTGKKMTDRIYYSYTGYPGGQRENTPATILAKKDGAEKLLRRVVKGMLPKNRLGAQLLRNLYIYEGETHNHEAQSPKAIDINLLK